MTAPSARDPGAQAAGRLRDIESVTDAALSRLGGQLLLQALLDRVKEILRADIAAVLLLDRPAGQLVATAASGIEDEVRQGVRIPLGAGFAGRVAASREPVILATVDAATVRNPLLVDRGIRPLLGVPLLAGGEVIGVLHVGSLSGRAFGPEDAELLQMAADRAALALHSLMAQDDALVAVALQRSLLPTALPVVPGLGLAVRYVTGSGTVGGDWYDVFALPGGRLGIVVGDVAGSGLQAAVIMGRMRSALRRLRAGRRGPGRRAAPAGPHDPVLRAGRDGHRAVRPVHPANRRAHRLLRRPPPARAGRTRPASGPAAPPARPPIGTADDPQRQSDTAFIPPGALLCCYTNGLVERRDHSIDHGIGKLAVTLDERIAARHRGTAVPPEEDACAAVMRTLVGNNPAPDDIAVLILSRHRDDTTAAETPRRRTSCAPSMRRGRVGPRDGGLGGRPA